jgi:hypothetical protein
MKSPDWQLSALGIPLTKLGYNSLKTSAIGTTTRRGRSQSFAAAVATFTLVPSVARGFAARKYLRQKSFLLGLRSPRLNNVPLGSKVARS